MNKSCVCVYVCVCVCVCVLESIPFHFQVTTLDKLSTHTYIGLHTCFCHHAAFIANSHRQTRRYSTVELPRVWQCEYTLMSPSVGHWDTCSLPSISNDFFQLTLELDKIWQRLCASDYLSKRFTVRDNSCCWV